MNSIQSGASKKGIMQNSPWAPTATRASKTIKSSFFLKYFGKIL